MSSSIFSYSFVLGPNILFNTLFLDILNYSAVPQIKYVDTSYKYSHAMMSDSMEAHIQEIGIS
jgi:hypothetical protein